MSPDPSNAAASDRSKIFANFQYRKTKIAFFANRGILVDNSSDRNPIAFFHPDGIAVVSDDENYIVFSNAKSNFFTYDKKSGTSKILDYNNIYQSFLIFNDSQENSIEEIFSAFPSETEIDSIIGKKYNLKGIVFVNGEFKFLMENLQNLRLYVGNRKKINIDTGIPFNYFSMPMFERSAGRSALRDIGVKIDLVTGRSAQTDVVSDWNQSINSCHFTNSISLVETSDANFAIKLKPLKAKKDKIALVFDGGPLSNPLSLIESGYVKYFRENGYTTYLLGYPGQIGLGINNIKSPAFDQDFSHYVQKNLKNIPIAHDTVLVGISFGYVPLNRALVTLNKNSNYCAIAVAPLLKLRNPNELYGNAEKIKYQASFENIHMGVNDANRDHINKIMFDKALKMQNSTVRYFFGRLDVLSKPSDLPKGDRPVKILDGDHNWVTPSETEIGDAIAACTQSVG